MEHEDTKGASVRLTRKYANIIDGVDLSRNQVGDLLDLSVRDARLLIAEGWASPDEHGKANGEDVLKPPPPKEERES